MKNYYLAHFAKLFKAAFMKRLWFILPFFCLHLSAYSQQEDWILLKETEGVKIYYAASACETEQFLTLKIENANLSAASVHLMLEVAEGEHRMHYPMLMAHVDAGQAEVLNCQNLGMTGDFIPFPVQQVSEVVVTVKDFYVAKN